MFNQNLRFLCEKLDLSQQKFADIMGVKRGKVSGYFYETTPKPEFQQRFASKFNLDLGKFLTQKMTEENFDSFFTTKTEITTIVNEPQGDYSTRSDIIEILMKLKSELDEKERSRLIDQAVRLVGKLMEKESLLMGEINQLQRDLLELARKG